MTNLMKLTSATALALLISGCNTANLSTPEKPKIDDTLEVIDSSSIRSIPDMNGIAFEWRKVDDPRVIGYHLYRASMQDDGTKLKLVETIDNRYTTHYLDDDLEPNTKYIYKISSATKRDVESRTTNDYIVSTLPRFESVSFIQAISNLPRQIKIVWRPHTNERVEYYEIQRTTPATSEWEKIETIDGRLQAEFIDLKLEDNVIYKYRIIAHTFDGIASIPSEAVKAQTKPLPEGILSLNASKDLARKIVLNWQPSASEDVYKYNIYRSSNPQSGFSKIKSVESKVLTYNDFINENGKVYFYKISSVDKDGLESDLNVNSTMGSTLPKLNKPIITLAQIQGEKAILNWQSNDKRTKSYIIHKTVKESYFNSKTFKIEGITELRYEDKDIVRGVEYNYAIQAVDENGIVSDLTNNTLLVLPKLQQEVK